MTINSWELEIENLEQKLKESNLEKRRLENENDKLKAQVDDLTDSRDDLKKTVESYGNAESYKTVRSNLTKAINNVLLSKEEVRSLKEQLTRKSNLQKRTAKRLAAKREQYRELEKKHIELTKRHEHTHSLYAATFEESYEVKWRQTEERLKEETDRLHDAAQNVYRLEEQFKRCEEDNERMRELIEEMSEYRKKALEHDANIIDNLENEVKELQLDIVGLVRKNRKGN